MGQVREMSIFMAGVALLLGGLLSASACTRSSVKSEAQGPIVLIVVDTLRADHVTCFGYSRPTTPSICSLEKDAVLFERAYTPRTQTTPAIASILTGLYPHEHGVRDLHSVLPDTHTTLPEILRAHGYRTGAFVSSFVMVNDFSGLGQGFETYDDHLTRKEPFRENFERAADETLTRALAWLDSAGSAAFLFVHLIEPHGPYTPPPPYLEKFALPKGGEKVPLDLVPSYQHIPGVTHLSEYVGRYDGEIASADAQVGRLLAHLAVRGWYEPATIVVTSDHGESMGELGEWLEHGRSVHDAEAHVPLIIKFGRQPDRRIHGGSRVAQPVSLVDVFATLLVEADLPLRLLRFSDDLRRLVDGQHWTGPVPLTELLHRRRLVLAVHGRNCMTHWKFRAILTDEGLLPNPKRASQWTEAAFEPARIDDQRKDECEQAVREVTPLVVDLLTKKRDFSVVQRLDVKEPGFRSKFVRSRQDPIVPLKESEREALRQLGYIE
jgi:arylsulfatase